MKKSKKMNSNSLRKELVTIGYDVPGLLSASKLKLNEFELKHKLGGKGAGLARMIQMKIPVPPAFNLSTELCQVYLMRQSLPESLQKPIQDALQGMARRLKKNFGQSENPLLLSVRSGAPVSMPGMMDTILNLGLNTEIVSKLAKENPNQARFWWDCFRRLIGMYSDVVLGLDRDLFERALENQKDKNSVELDSDLSAENLQSLCFEFLDLIRAEGKEFPEDPMLQLRSAIEAVFRSWNTDRAIHYRESNQIPHSWGTSVTIQAMVFGNRNENSGTGVVFTRNPSTGENRLYGEYLMNAQGEDVVAGIRTPKEIQEMKKTHPKVYRELEQTLKNLEKRFNDVQDVEFTIEDQKLFILQTRSAKRTATAQITNAVQFVKEKRLSQKESLHRLDYRQIDQLLHPSLKPTDQSPIGKGLPASPGAVSGLIAFDPQIAVQYSRAGEKVILVRRETSPEDIMGMSVAEGILTATGGMTSHAAVVGRGMGKACVVGCSELRIDEHQRTAELGGVQLIEGKMITLNGSTGEVYEGALPTQALSWTPDAKKFFDWADQESKMKVYANADTPEQGILARDLGAVGIGLCRTEHMFFEVSRLREFRKMILSSSGDVRSAAMAKLLEHQRSDFKALLKAMNPLSVCVRLLDPPLHEFLPSSTDKVEFERLAQELEISMSELKERISQLGELNPMLGHRGCRLGITQPDIYRMQIQAAAEALGQSVREGVKTHLKLMIPLIMDAKELENLLPDLKAVFDKVAEESFAKEKKQMEKLVSWGTMIELPRACLMADQIAPLVDFLSFGTNDLTQTTMGLSRDDSGKFLPEYQEKGIVSADPFQSLDVDGVGGLIQIALLKARKANPKISVGVCGEHGGDPQSIPFFHDQAFDSVSCSPFRVPIARLASARAALTKSASSGKAQSRSLKKKRSS